MVKINLTIQQIDGKLNFHVKPEQEEVTSLEMYCSQSIYYQLKSIIDNVKEITNDMINRLLESKIDTSLCNAIGCSGMNNNCKYDIDNCEIVKKAKSNA